MPVNINRTLLQVLHIAASAGRAKPVGSDRVVISGSSADAVLIPPVDRPALLSRARQECPLCGHFSLTVSSE